MFRSKKVGIAIFDTPPLQNHCFWLTGKARWERKWNLEALVTAVATDGSKVKGCWHDSVAVKVR